MTVPLSSNNDQQAIYLKEALLAVKIQSRLMKQCLVKYSNKLKNLETQALYILFA